MRLKQTLMAVFVIGISVTLVGAGTLAYFSDTETSTGNIFTAGILDFQDVAESYTIEGAVQGTETEQWDYTFRAHPDCNIDADHVELKFETYGFVEGSTEPGEINGKDAFLKQIEVTELDWVGSPGFDLTDTLITDDGADGTLGFISLFDVEATGVYDDLHLGPSPPLPPGSQVGSLGVKLKLGAPMPDEASAHKYEGDSVKFDIIFAAVQAPGQDVLV